MGLHLRNSLVLPLPLSSWNDWPEEMVGWPFTESTTIQVERPCSAKQCALGWAIRAKFACSMAANAPIARTCRSTHYGPHYLLKNACFPSCHPGLCWSRDLTPKGSNASTKKHNNSIGLEVVTTIGHSGQLVPQNQQAKEGGNVLMGWWLTLITKGKSDGCCTVEVTKSMSGIQAILSSIWSSLRPCG